MNQPSPSAGDVSASPFLRMAYDDPLTFGWRLRALLELKHQSASPKTAEDDKICLVNLGLYLRDKHGAQTCHAVCMYLDGTLDWPASLLEAVPTYLKQSHAALLDSLLTPEVSERMLAYKAKHQDAEAQRPRLDPPKSATPTPAMSLSPRARKILEEMQTRDRAVSVPRPPRPLPVKEPPPVTTPAYIRPVVRRPPVRKLRAEGTPAPEPPTVDTPVMACEAPVALVAMPEALVAVVETTPLPMGEMALKTPLAEDLLQPLTVPDTPTTAVRTPSIPPLDPRLVEIIRRAKLNNGVPLNRDIRQLRAKLNIPQAEVVERLKRHGFYPDKTPEQVSNLLNNTLSGLTKWSEYLMRGLLVAFHLTEDEMVRALA